MIAAIVSRFSRRSNPKTAEPQPALTLDQTVPGQIEVENALCAGLALLHARGIPRSPLFIESNGCDLVKQL